MTIPVRMQRRNLIAVQIDVLADGKTTEIPIIFVSEEEMNQLIETDLIYMQPHADTVTSVGFTKIKYSLMVTDGGTGTLNSGEREIP